MKKYLPGLLAVLACSAQAQVSVPDGGGFNADHPGRHSLSGRAAQRTNIISDWYNYGQTVYDMGGGVSYFRNFLFSDSTVRVNFSDGIGYVWKHSIGQVLDPSSPIFTSGGQYEVENHIPYTVDSIAIPYRYWRFQHSAPDTLVVQVYLQPDIKLVPAPGWSSGASYANVEYDYQQRLGINDTLTIKYLLTAADTSTISQDLLRLYAGITVPAGQKVAATATYFPGNPYNINDTIDTYAPFPIHHRINAFLMYDFRDNDLGYEPLYYNNELTVTTDVRYNFNTNGWNGEYIPGTAWLSGIYYADMYFKLTFDSEYVGIDEMSATSGTGIYPNPTGGLIRFTGDQPVVQARILNLEGKTVVQESGSRLSGIDASALGQGVYLLQLQQADGRVQHHRFVKQ